MIGSHIVRVRVTGSTNSYLLDWLSRERPEEGTLVIAEHQTAGRGLDTNRWESEPGRNLTFSFVLYPVFLAADAQFYLNKAISLGLCDLVSGLVEEILPVSVKWPNDIYIGDHKVAGVLIQNGVKGAMFDYSVIGIGLNVNQDAFSGGAPNPVSLKMVTGKDYDLDGLLQSLISRLEDRMIMLRSGRKPELDAQYLNALYRMGTISDYIYKGNPVRAKISGVSRYGQLQLEIPGEKMIECDLKEIKFVI